MWQFWKPTQYEQKYGNLAQGFSKMITTWPQKIGLTNKIRKFGSFMAGMIIPAIGVLIAWGLFTAIILAVKTGIAYQLDIPINEWTAENSTQYLLNLDTVIGHGISFIIPLIIAFLGGRQIYQWRGALVGFVATLGVISYSQIQPDTDWFLANMQTASVADIPNKWTFNAIMALITNNLALLNTAPSPMILGALISGPLFASLFKQFEKLYQNRIKAGFDMLVNNFALGIFGTVTIFVGFFGIGPLMAVFQVGFFVIINGINAYGLLYILPIFIEFEKVIFLNNAVNHGILGPLGLNAVNTVGFSPLFYLDPNPGQGLGLLAAYLVFGNKENKSQASAALPVHFIGGIHEVYYPFVLTRPINLLFMMVGGVFASAMYQIFDFGGIFTPSPGSVIMNFLAVYSVKPLNYLTLLIAIFGAAFLVFSLTSVSLLWNKLVRGERIIWDYKKLFYLNRYQKSLQVANLSSLKTTLNNITTVNYSKTKSSQPYLLETIHYQDGSVSYSILPQKGKRLVDCHYLTLQKPNGKQVVYATKYFSKKANPKPLPPNWQQMWTAKFAELLKQYESKNEQITNRFTNPSQQAYYLQKLAVWYTQKSYQLNAKHYKQTHNYNSKRFVLKKNEPMITKVSYQTTEFAFLKRVVSYTKDEQHKRMLRKIDWLPITAQQEQLADLQQVTNQAAAATNAINATSNANDAFMRKVATAKTIYFACEAGVGSSAMGANMLAKNLKNLGVNQVVVKNCAIKDLPSDVDIIVTQQTFAQLVKQQNPNSYVYSINQFLQKQEYQPLLDAFANNKQTTNQTG